MIPYEDEELYSWIVRQIKHGIYCNYHDILLELTGQTMYSRRHRYLGRIDYLSKTLEKVGYTSEVIVDKMTLFNLVKPFYKQDRVSRIKRALLGKSERLYNYYSFHKSGMFDSDKKCYKICPICFKEDRENYGEAYLHRNHNFPGVKTCYKHQCYLDIIPYQVNRKAPYYDVDTEYIPDHIVYPPENLRSFHSKMNKDLIYLLEGNMNALTPDIIREKINNKLCILGVFNRPFLNNDLLFKNFYVKYPESFLAEYDLGEKMEIFIFGSLKDFVDFSDVFEPFGKASYPCMNKVCCEDNKEVIHKFNGKYLGKEKGFVGKFKCDTCGYTYTLSTKVYNGTNFRSVCRLNKPGDLWLSKLSEYTKLNYNSNKIGELLGVPHSTVAYYVRKNGLDKQYTNGFTNRIIADEEDLCIKVKKVVNRIIDNKEEIRITMTLLAKEVAYAGINYKNALAKKPKLKVLLENSIESVEEYKKS